jgi:hypothetical protein
MEPTVAIKAQKRLVSETKQVDIEQWRGQVEACK